MKPKKNKNMSYTVALLTKAKADYLVTTGSKAFWNEDNDEYYTYTDLASASPTTSITQSENDNLVMGVVSGSFPVYKKPRRPMYPR